jgi:hypothetical protein
MAKPIIPSESWIAPDFSPETFGRLTTISSPYKPEGAKSPVQDFVCSCGNKVTKPRVYVKCGNTKSCGCAKTEATTKRNKENAKHGYFGTPTYRSWEAMVARCEDSEHHAYHNYGGRGIKIHPDIRDFAGFLACIGERPSKEYSLDRIDNNGNYEPGNIRWATRKEQGRNQRTNRMITALGKTQCISAWAEETGLSYDCIRGRLKAGWNPDDAMTYSKEIPPRNNPRCPLG